MKRLETDRLELRPFETSDLQAVYQQIYSDPEVCHFFCGSTRTRAHTKRWLYFQSYRGHHNAFGLLAVVIKETQRLIGLCGLGEYVGHHLILESEPEHRYYPVEVELTYALGKEYWGQGFASEACRAMIDYAFRELRLRRLVTGCHPDNVRASRLQDRLGMRKERNLHPDYQRLEGILENDRV
jgi:RimJ/RimL family protein N-acetyltransferase